MDQTVMSQMQFFNKILAPASVEIYIKSLKRQYESNRIVPQTVFNKRYKAPRNI